VQAGVESYLMLVLLPVGLYAAEHARVIADCSEGTDKTGRAKKGGRSQVRKGVGAVIAVAFFATAGVVHADPIKGAGASTGPKGMLIIEPHFTYLGFKERYDVGKGEWVDLGPGQEVHFQMALLRVTYGISERVWPRVNIPYWWREMKMGPHGGTSDGYGDIVVDLKTKLIKGENLQQGLVLLTAVRLPTGDSDEVPPIGDGSTDVGVGLTASKRFGPVQLNGMTAWWFNEKNDFGSDEDELEYSASAQVLLSRSVIPNIEAYGKYLEGGEQRSLDLILGLQYWPSRKLLLEAAVQTPVDNKGGFKYDAAPYVGLMALF